MKGPIVKNPVGRPVVYSHELAVEVCDRISQGESLIEIVEDKHIPAYRTIMYWRRDNAEFMQMYARAKEEQAEAYEDLLLREARTNGDVNRARLIVDTMKWTASKLKPKKYGDKIDHTTNGKDLPTPILGGLSALPSDDSSTQAR